MHVNSNYSDVLVATIQCVTVFSCADVQFSFRYTLLTSYFMGECFSSILLFHKLIMEADDALTS